MRSKLVAIYWALVLVTVISSCASSSKINASAAHELSARYNVLYHGEEALEQALNTLDDLEEDYGQPLSFIAPSLRAGARDSSIFGLLERAETKAVKAVQKHSVTLNNKEYNKHIPRAYNLIGKARLLAGNSFEAIEAFEKAKSIATTRADLDQAYWGLALSRYHLGETEAALRDLLAIEKSDKPKASASNVRLLALELLRNRGADSLEAIMDQVTAKKLLPKYPMRAVYAIAQQYESMGNSTKAQDLYRFLSKKAGYDKARFRILAQLRLAQLTSADSTAYFKRLYQIEKRWNNYDHRYFVDHDRGRWLLSRASTQTDIDRAKYLDSLAVSAFERSNVTASERVRALNFDYLAQHFLNRKDYPLSFAYYDTLVGGFVDQQLRRPMASRVIHQKLKTYLELTDALKEIDSVLAKPTGLVSGGQDEILTLMPSAEKKRVERSKSTLNREEQLNQKVDLTFEAVSLLAYDFNDLQGAKSLLTPFLTAELSNQTKAAALFRLYQISALFEETKGAEAYKEALLANHSNSIYTLYLDDSSNPNQALEGQLAQLFSENKYDLAYDLVQKAYAQRQPLGPESLLISARVEARLFGLEVYAKRLEEIKQVFRNTWADREASLLLAQLSEGNEAGIARAERYALVFNADDETLEKWRAISAKKLREQNYDLNAVIEPFDRQSSYLVVGWFSSEAYAQAFYKRNAAALNASRVAVVSQEDYVSAQWTKKPLF